MTDSFGDSTSPTGRPLSTGQAYAKGDGKTTQRSGQQQLPLPSTQSDAPPTHHCPLRTPSRTLCLDLNDVLCTVVFSVSISDLSNQGRVAGSDLLLDHWMTVTMFRQQSRGWSLGGIRCSRGSDQGHCQSGMLRIASHWIWILCFFLGILWTSMDPEYSLRQPWKSGRLTLIFLDVWRVIGFGSCVFSLASSGPAWTRSTA